MHRSLSVLLYAIGVLAPLFAAAQAPIRISGPADTGAPTPAPVYTSVFSEYRKHREPELADWRAANDEVARVGGHIGIFRAGGFNGSGASQPAPTEGEKQAPSTPRPHQH